MRMNQMNCLVSFGLLKVLNFPLAYKNKFQLWENYSFLEGFLSSLFFEVSIDRVEWQYYLNGGDNRKYIMLSYSSRIFTSSFPLFLSISMYKSN